MCRANTDRVATCCDYNDVNRANVWLVVERASR
jgi:hypothetical protein